MSQPQTADYPSTSKGRDISQPQLGMTRMAGKCHNHRLQTIPRHRKGETSASHRLQTIPRHRKGETSASHRLQTNPRHRKGETSASHRLQTIPRHRKGETSASHRLKTNPRHRKGKTWNTASQSTLKIKATSSLFLRKRLLN